MIRVLILGGTAEASALASALADDRRFETTLSLAGATRSPRPAPVATRVGGFGGAAGLALFLRHSGTRAVIDATHPYALQISRNARLACAGAAVPMLRLARPAWQAAAGDRWIVAADMDSAAGAIGGAPARVLLTIGRKDLAPFAREARHHYIVRSVDAPPPALLPPGAEVLAARGPFRLADERALFAARAVAVLVTRNSGGAVPPKLRVARERGVPVVMVAHPPRSDAPQVPDTASALRWLAGQAHAGTPRAV